MPYQSFRFSGRFSASFVARRLMSSVVLAAVTSTSLPALAKTSVCSPVYEAQIRAKFYGGDQISQTKVDAEIARLEKKRTEVAAIDTGKVEYEADLKGEDAKQKKIEKALKKSKSLLALDAAISTAKSMKSASSLADMCDATTAISDLEGAVRVEGALKPIVSLLATAKTVLSKWSIPKVSSPADEASNLVDPRTGAIMTADDLAAAQARGQDLSLLEPARGSVFYTPVKDVQHVDMRSAGDGSTIPMFADLNIKIPSNPVFIYGSIKKSDTKPKVDATIDGVKNADFKLKFASEFNADPTVGAIMNAIGFPSDLSRYQAHIKMVLPKGVSFHDMARDWESYFSRDSVKPNSRLDDNIELQSVDAQGRTVITWKQGSIEVHPKAIARVGGWKYGDGDHNSRREVRGMTLVQMWLDNSDLKEFENNKMLLRKNADGSVTRMLMDSDVGHSLGGLFLESPSMYKWNLVSSTNGNSIDLTYRLAHPVSIKGTMTLADARWGARLISKLSREQMNAALTLGGWPSCVQKAFLERMVARRNNLVTALGLVGTRNNDGSVIQLLQETKDRNAFDIENICEAQPGVKDAVDTYGFNVGTFFSPLVKELRNEALTLARTSLSGEKRLVISSKRFNTSGPHPIGEVILNMSRDIERNPKPTTEQDLFIVKDHFEIGTRVGVAYGPYVAVVVRANYELAYPARSLQEGNVNNGFIVNLLLPKDARQGKLPASYVLKSEYSREFELGVNFDHLASPVSPVIRAAAGELKLWRSIYDHRDGKKLVLYRDKADSKLIENDLFVRLGLLQIPVIQMYHDWGNAEGKGVILSQAELDNDPSLSVAIDKAVVDGNFTKTLTDREQPFYTDDDFKRTMHKWSLLVWKSNTEKRLDKIDLTTDKAGSREVVQYRLAKGSTLSIPMVTKVDRKAVVEVWTDPTTPSNYELQVNVMGSDLKVSDNEMQAKYLHFINGLALNSKPLIPLTASANYTTNGSWGNILAQSNTSYSVTAMNRILNASTAQFWAALAGSMGLSVNEVSAMAWGGDRSHAQDGVIDHAKHFLQMLAKAKSETDTAKRVQKLAEAFRHAIFVEKAGFYSPAILGALNRLAGEDQIYSRNLITVPEPLMLDLIDGTPMFAKIGSPLPGARQYLIFEPLTALDLYTMFDTWF